MGREEGRGYSENTLFHVYLVTILYSDPLGCLDLMFGN